MKKLFAAFSAALIILAAACDKIDSPIENYTPPEEPRRKVLLEDYTGHTCGNCPGAAEVASTLHDKYGDELVVIAVHAGWFSKTEKKYPTSYTTTAGNDWNLHYIGKDGLYPNGSVNRKNYTGTGIMSKETKWAELVELGFQDDYVLDLTLAQEYGDRVLNVGVKANFRMNYDKEVMISVVLVEDSIIGPQLDYRNQENTYVQNYVFMHMLRDAINGSWGTPLTAGAVSAGDSLIVKFDDFAVKPEFNDKHLSVVAFAYEKESREVLEVEKIKVSTKKSEF